MARGRQGDPILTGAHIQGEMFRNKMALPNEHDLDAELFSDIGKSVGEKPRGWRALAAGISKGLEHGAKTKGNEKRQKEADKYDKVMNYLTEANNAAVERTQWYETREKAREEFLPQVVSYMDNIDRLDPQSRQIMAQNILTGYGNALGENFKLKSIDGADPFVVTLETKKGTQIMDLRTLFAGDELMQQKIAMKMPEYQLKLQQERQDKERDFKLKEEALKAKYPNPSQSNEEENYGSIPLTAMKGRGTTSLFNTINAEMNLAKEAPIIMNMLNEAKAIIAAHPKVGSAWANIVGKSDAARSLLGAEDRAAYEKLNKISNRISESYIKAKGGSITDSERETIKKGLFDVSLSPEANQYNINSLEKELKVAKVRGDFSARELSKGFIATSESFNNYVQQNPQLIEGGGQNNPTENKVVIFDPETGEKVKIYEKDLDKAINQGWELQQ